MPETTSEIVIKPSIKNTMQALPNAEKDGGLASGFWTQYTRNPILAPFGTRKRETDLRAIWRHDYNTAIRGAFTGIASEIAGKRYKITGPEKLDKDASKYYKATAKALNMPQVESADRPDIAYFDYILRYADFGRGWASFVQKFVLDYLRQDAGGFVEVIAPGAATKAPKGAISGLATLDSLRCWPTGDPEYPVVYWNRKAEYHLIHNQRVIQFQDMPDSDEMTPGYGMCALSRAIGIAYREVLMAQYLEAQLDDKPPPGIINASNMNEASRNTMLALYRKDQATDVKPEWGKLMWAFPLDPSLPNKFEVVQFSVPPEKFDWKIYTELDVNLLALAIGVDVQDLWQLTGGSGLAGSKGQSETLSQKSRGKMKGLLTSEITRKLNDLFPDEMELSFDERDANEEAEKAERAKTWAGVASSLSGVLSPDQQLQLVANNSEEVRDVVTDEDGNMLSIEDGDVQTAQQIADDAAAAHALELAATRQPPASANGGRTGKPVPKRPAVGAKLGRSEHDSGEKAYEDTRAAFERDFADLIKARVSDEIDGRRFGVLARAQLAKYGKQALRDGLEDGGVPQIDSEGVAIPLDSEDEKAFNSWLVKQSAYVTNFGQELRHTDALNADARAQLWGNKSLEAIYSEGVASADRNGNYEFVGDDGEESCKTCQRLKGQVHRYKDWKRKELIPQKDTHAYECKGFRCQHSLQKTTDRARGRF